MRIAFLLAALVPASLSAQLPRPSSWKTLTDGGVTDTVSFVPMPPGWHVTTGPGALLYDPAHTASGRYAVSMEVYLFPGTSQSGYGLFVGGSALESADAGYLAFTVTRDGAAAVERVEGARRTTLLPAWRAAAVKPHPGGDETVFNVLTVRIEPDSVRFDANGARVAALPRGTLPLDGAFGIRAGAGVNLHVSNIDFTTRLAPAPRPPR
jgi:hypothetical protein